MLNNAKINILITLGETRDLGMDHVDTIDFMLKSTVCQLSIDDPLTVHFQNCNIIIYLQLIENSQIIY